MTRFSEYCPRDAVICSQLSTLKLYCLKDILFSPLLTFQTPIYSLNHFETRKFCYGLGKAGGRCSSCYVLHAFKYSRSLINTRADTDRLDWPFHRWRQSDFGNCRQEWRTWEKMKNFFKKKWGKTHSNLNSGFKITQLLWCSGLITWFGLFSNNGGMRHGDSALSADRFPNI